MLVFENDFAPCIDALRQACPTIQRFVAIDGPTPHADLTLEDLLARGRVERPDLFSFDENEICELFYTSGSTGTPKGVMLSHRTIFMHALLVGLTAVTFSCSGAKGVEASSNLIRHDMDSFGGASGELARKRE